MKTTSKIAFGGIVAALSVAIMFLSFIPVLTYVLPELAGALIVLTVIEFGKGWAFLTYLTVGIVSFFVAADREASILYILFFGFYPILKAIFESKLPRVLEWVFKFLLFNSSMVASYFILVFVFNLPMEEMKEFGKFSLPILISALNLMFWLYDFALTKAIILYERRLKKVFRKIFK